MARKMRQQANMTGRAVIAQATDIDDEAVMILPDGRSFQKTVFALSEEQVERIRAGYTCVKCLEDYDSAFPDECMVCKFPMREQQSAEFAKDFRGRKQFGPSTTLDEEREIMNEIREEQTRKRAQELGLTIVKPSIIVPRDF